MQNRFLAVSLWMAMGVTAQAQTLVGYWDMNGSTDRSSGSSGVLTRELEDLGISFLGYGTGTGVNLESGFLPGESLAFVNLASVLETGHVTVSSLNLTGLATPTFSFAVRSTPAFEFGDVLKLEYNTGGGWTTAALLATPSTSYSLVSHTFSSGLLDNLANVGIRITFSSLVSVADTFEVDNLKIEAVPEPAAFALFATSAFIFLPLIRRRLVS